MRLDALDVAAEVEVKVELVNVHVFLLLFGPRFFVTGNILPLHLVLLS